MSGESERFERAVERFDAAHRVDPTLELDGGKKYPAAFLYHRRLATWLDRLEPGASEALRLAVSCQHIERWTVPRHHYPRDREGYHRWRAELARMHARRAREILSEVGYDDATIRRVEMLLTKEDLREDPDTQTLEDVICLVFLESYLAEFAERHDEKKLLGILRKTWKKMSARGQRSALELQLPPPMRSLIEKALAPYPKGAGGGSS